MARSAPKRTKKTARASISFPPDVYQELEKLAAAKNVSIAWVVREAAAKYVANQWSPSSDAERGHRS